MRFERILKFLIQESNACVTVDDVLIEKEHVEIILLFSTDIKPRGFIKFIETMAFLVSEKTGLPAVVRFIIGKDDTELFYFQKGDEFLKRVDDMRSTEATLEGATRKEVMAHLAKVIKKCQK